MKAMFIFFLLSIVASTNLLSSAETTEEIVFIVNSENPISQLTTNDISDYYFKRKRIWPNLENVRFIDRSPENSLRHYFLKNVLKKSRGEVEQFWIGQKLYTGDSAPLGESTDQGTIKFCSSFKGALGYISPTSVTALTNKNVKTIKVESKGD